MERRECKCPGAQCCSRRWKDTVQEFLYALALLMIGMAIGIGMCKLWPEFWRWLNWGVWG